jgi:endoglucanase
MQPRSAGADLMAACGDLRVVPIRSQPWNRPLFLRLVVLAGSLLFGGRSEAAMAAAGVLHAGDGVVVDGGGKAVLLRCVNLAAWLIPEGYLVGQGSLAALTTSPSQFKHRLDALVGRGKALAFWSQWANTFVKDSDFDALKQQGFNCVRLPLTHRDLVTANAQGAVVLDAAGMAPVDNALAWGAAHGIYVFLDLHDAPGGQNALASVSDVPSADRVARLWQGPTAAANQERTVALWRALAMRYSRASSLGGYDLLNEPDIPRGVPAEELARLYDRIIAAIRTVDRSHLIVLEGNRYAHDFSALRAPADGNLMYEFHEYSLFNPAWRVPTLEKLTPFLQLRATTHKPLWLGEFGEESGQWQREIVQLMKANGIGWAVWPWKRIDLKNGHPVMHTIEVPPDWTHIAGYLVGRWFAPKPAPSLAEQAMAHMLEAVQTTSCREDLALEKTLAGE